MSDPLSTHKARDRFMSRARDKLTRDGWGERVIDPVLREAWWANRDEARANTELFAAAREVASFAIELLPEISQDHLELYKAFVVLTAAVGQCWSVIQSNNPFPDTSADQAEDPWKGLP